MRIPCAERSKCAGEAGARQTGAGLWRERKSYPEAPNEWVNWAGEVGEVPPDGEELVRGKQAPVQNRVSRYARRPRGRIRAREGFRASVGE